MLCALKKLAVTADIRENTGRQTLIQGIYL